MVYCNCSTALSAAGVTQHLSKWSGSVSLTTSYSPLPLRASRTPLQVMLIDTANKLTVVALPPSGVNAMVIWVA